MRNIHFGRRKKQNNPPGYACQIQFTNKTKRFEVLNDDPEEDYPVGTITMENGTLTVRLNASEKELPVFVVRTTTKKICPAKKP